MDKVSVKLSFMLYGEDTLQTADIMFHIDDKLDPGRQQAIELELGGMEGVIAPRFNKPCLLVISSNPEISKTSVLLKALKDKGCQVQAVGM